MDGAVRDVFQLELEGLKTGKLVHLGDDLGCVAGSTHGTRAVLAVEEVARQAVLVGKNLAVGRADVLERSVNQTLPLTAVASRLGLVTAVAANSGFSVPEIRLSGVLGILNPIPVPFSRVS